MEVIHSDSEHANVARIPVSDFVTGAPPTSRPTSVPSEDSFLPCYEANIRLGRNQNVCVPNVMLMLLLLVSLMPLIVGCICHVDIKYSCMSSYMAPTEEIQLRQYIILMKLR